MLWVTLRSLRIVWPSSTGKVGFELDYHHDHEHLCVVLTEDPWRFATPHSDNAVDRDDTALRPFKIIPGELRISIFCQVLTLLAGAVHHYDEYGYNDLAGEPPQIRRIHEEMISFVQSWLSDWRARKSAVAISNDL